MSHPRISLYWFWCLVFLFLFGLCLAVLFSMFAWQCVWICRSILYIYRTATRINQMRGTSRILICSICSMSLCYVAVFLLVLVTCSLRLWLFFRHSFYSVLSVYFLISAAIILHNVEKHVMRSIVPYIKNCSVLCDTIMISLIYIVRRWYIDVSCLYQKLSIPGFLIMSSLYSFS